MMRFAAAAVVLITASETLYARLRYSDSLGLDTAGGAVWPALCILLAYAITQIGRTRR